VKGHDRLPIGKGRVPKCEADQVDGEESRASERPRDAIGERCGTE
jgi:hypothetical protein